MTDRWDPRHELGQRLLGPLRLAQLHEPEHAGVAGSTADETREWKVTGTELLAEVAKVKTAQKDHQTPFCREATQSA